MKNKITREELREYSIVYQITALPIVIYAEQTKGDEVLTFKGEEIYIPEEIKGTPIELRITVFNKKGELVELTSTMLPPAGNTIAACANVTVLKLINNIIMKEN